MPSRARYGGQAAWTGERRFTDRSWRFAGGGFGKIRAGERGIDSGNVWCELRGFRAELRVAYRQIKADIAANGLETALKQSTRKVTPPQEEF